MGLGDTLIGQGAWEEQWLLSAIHLRLLFQNMESLKVTETFGISISIDDDGIFDDLVSAGGRIMCSRVVLDGSFLCVARYAF